MSSLSTWATIHYAILKKFFCVVFAMSTVWMQKPRANIRFLKAFIRLNKMLICKLAQSVHTDGYTLKHVDHQQVPKKGSFVSWKLSHISLQMLSIKPKKTKVNKNEMLQIFLFVRSPIGNKGQLKYRRNIFRQHNTCIDLNARGKNVPTQSKSFYGFSDTSRHHNDSKQANNCTPH